MEEAEERIRKAVEEATSRVEGRKESPRTKRSRVVQRSEEVLDSDAEIEVVQDLVRIPTAVPLNGGMDEPSLTESKEMCIDEEVARKNNKKAGIVSTFQFQVLFD